jgi:hypothetical protein
MNNDTYLVGYCILIAFMFLVSTALYLIGRRLPKEEKKMPQTDPGTWELAGGAGGSSSPRPIFTILPFGGRSEIPKTCGMCGEAIEGIVHSAINGSPVHVRCSPSRIDLMCLACGEGRMFGEPERHRADCPSTNVKRSPPI